jgi:hypothetical protein
VWHHGCGAARASHPINEPFSHGDVVSRLGPSRRPGYPDHGVLRVRPGSVACGMLRQPMSRSVTGLSGLDASASSEAVANCGKPQAYCPAAKGCRHDRSSGGRGCGRRAGHLAPARALPPISHRALRGGAPLPMGLPMVIPPNQRMRKAQNGGGH